MNDKEWTQLFKTLANSNRIKIIRLLAAERRLAVSDIAPKIHISFSATSRHLIMLDRAGILESLGSAGHVFYYISPALAGEPKFMVERIIKAK